MGLVQGFGDLVQGQAAKIGRQREEIEVSEFLKGIKAGQYIKTQYRNERPIVRKVAKVTATQIVTSEWMFGDKPKVSRFRIADGFKMGESYWYRTNILESFPSAEEIAAYEERTAEGERMRNERQRLSEFQAWAKCRFSEMFPNVPAENIEVGFSSRDNFKTSTWGIKIENMAEDVLASILSETGAGGSGRKSK
jgi:hypothetical protein